MEDELADAVIRLFDIWAEAFPNKEVYPPSCFFECRVKGLTLTEFAGMVAATLFDPEIYGFLDAANILCGVYFDGCMRYAIDMLYSYAKNEGIGLERHILLKMRYNATRPRLHGKKY